MHYSGYIKREHTDKRQNIMEVKTTYELINNLGIRMYTGMHHVIVCVHGDVNGNLTTLENKSITLESIREIVNGIHEQLNNAPIMLFCCYPGTVINNNWSTLENLNINIPIDWYTETIVAEYNNTLVISQK